MLFLIHYLIQAKRLCMAIRKQYNNKLDSLQYHKLHAFKSLFVYNIKRFENSKQQQKNKENRRRELQRKQNV